MPSVKEMELEVDTSRDYLKMIVEYEQLTHRMQDELKQKDKELEQANKIIAEQEETIRKLTLLLGEYHLSEQNYQTLSTECEKLLKRLEILEEEKEKWKELAEELQK